LLTLANDICFKLVLIKSKDSKLSWLNALEPQANNAVFQLSLPKSWFWKIDPVLSPENFVKVA
jgi:hypothetical protein